MQRTIIGLAVLLLVGWADSRAHATDGTCTITRAISSNNLNLTFPIPVVIGMVLPASFDEASGTFSLSRDPWATQYGATGVEFATGFGPSGWLILPPGFVTGTIDAAGNVTLPNFGLAFATNFCPPRSPDYPLLPTLMTGTQFLRVTGETSALTGVPLDFTTGSLTLEGQDVIPAACGAPSALLSGLRLTCTLSPIPNAAALPPSPTALTGASAKAVIGKPLPEEPPAKPAKGDVLTVKAKLGTWATIADVAANDVYVNLRAGETNVVLRVAAGKFHAQGKKATVKDKTVTDPSLVSIEVPAGHKATGTVSAAYGGSMTFAGGKKGLVLKVRVLGLDLEKLTGAGTLAVGVGSKSATVAVTASGEGKVRKVK